MSINPDLAAEQKFIAHAYDRLESMRRSAKEMMEEVLRNPRGGTHQARAERDVVVRQSLNRLEQLEIGDQALCFGGIDYNDSRNDISKFHIGRIAVADVDMEPLVVDWRAPVAEPFYRATGKESMGLSRRRHFAAEHRQIVAIEDEYFSPDDIGDVTSSDSEVQLLGAGALFAAVTRARTGQMADIVATIQAQQDEIIRSPLSQTLVVQGGPGTGKTAVALHRAAYLLYTHRLRLERQGVLVVAPSRIFAKYIDQVLPSLGETGVEILTVESLAGFGEAVLSEGRGERLIKGDLRMVDFIAKAIRDRQRPLKSDVEIAMGAFVVNVSVEDTLEVVKLARRRSGTHNQRRKFVESFLAIRVAEKYLLKREARANDNLTVENGFDVEFTEYPSNPNGEEDMRKKLALRVRKSPEFQAIVQRIWPKLTPETFLGDLFGHMPLIRLAGKDLFSPDELQSLYRSSARGDIGSKYSWTRSDVILLNEARTLLGGVSKNRGNGKDEERGYGHIIIDEAQDLSPMAARMVGRYSLSGSMTLVGDIAQSTSPFGSRTWAEIISPLPKAKESHIVELSINYRTPQEVMEIANQLMKRYAPSLRPTTSIRHSGQPVEIVNCEDGKLAETLCSTLQKELDLVEPGKVCLIVPIDAKASLITELTRSGIDVGPNMDFPVSVMSVEEVKGLEFDSVVISGVNALLSSDSGNIQSLFVAMTRTTNRLVILDNKDLPDFLFDLAFNAKP